VTEDFPQIFRLTLYMVEVLRRFKYSRVIGEGQVEAVLQVYEEVGRSCLRTSLQPEVACSEATVNRIVRKAVEKGAVASDFGRSKGRPLADRGRIRDLLNRYPEAMDKQIAPLAGVSAYTVGEIRKGKR
jgi:hypothetical protein